MRRQEIAASLAVVLYILFFSMPPPAIVSAILDNIVGMVAAAAGAAYVTLYMSKVVGGLLLLALVLSISRGGREGLTTQAWSADTVYNPGDMMTLDGKTYVAVYGNNHMGKTDPEFARYWKESVPITPGAPWSASADYKPMDTMTSGGKTYIAKLGNNNMPPSNPQFSTYWMEQSTPATTPTPGASTTPPAATPPTTTVPAPTAAKETTVSPIMSCNLESYSNFKRSEPQDFAAF